MLKSNTRNLKGLNLYNQHGKQAHIVNPYKTSKDPIDPDLEYIYVYDNNYPNDTTRKIRVYISDDVWYYNMSENAGILAQEWGGATAHKGLNLDTTVRYWYQPVLLANVAKKQPLIKLLPATGNIEIYNSDSCDISITNLSNQTIGCLGGILVNTIPDAIPMLIFSTDQLSPKGYFLPEDEYNAEMLNFTKQDVSFSVFNNSTMFGYYRKAPALNQKDRFLVGTDGIEVRNPDSTPKSIQLSCSFEDAGSEMSITIRNLGAPTNSICAIQRFNSSEVKLVNNGVASKYDLSIRYLSNTGESAFTHDSIIIPANTAHVISPEWESLKTAVMKIFVDNGNNLSYEDTLYFGNSELPKFLSYPTSLSIPKTGTIDTVFIANSGGGVLNWTAESSDTSWLKLTAAFSGVDTGRILVLSLSNTGGARSGTITYTASGAANSPYIINVKQIGKINAPLGVNASDGVSSAGVSVSFHRSDSASHYRVYRSNNAGSSFSPISSWRSDTVFTDTTCVKGRFYYYSAKAASDSLGSDSTGYSASDDGWRAGFTADFTASGECQGQSVLFKENCTAHEKINYLWDINNDGTIDYTGEKFDHIFNTAGNYEIKLTATDSSSFTETVLKSVVIKPFPQLSFVQDTIVCANQSVVLEAGAGFQSYLWSTGATTSSITIDSTGIGLGMSPVSVNVVHSNGCSAIATTRITWDTCTNAGGFSLSGIATYDNAFLTPLNSIEVRLMQGGTVVYQTTTDAQGHYSFTNIPNGSYELSPVCIKPWGGVNSIDALLILRKFAGLVNLQGVRLIAADVNASNSVNSVDALLVAKRFVAMISSFTAGDWAFEKPVIVVSGPANQTLDIKGVVYGDVDGSFVPLQ